MSRNILFVLKYHRHKLIDLMFLYHVWSSSSAQFSANPTASDSGEHRFGPLWTQGLANCRCVSMIFSDFLYYAAWSCPAIIRPLSKNSRGMSNIKNEMHFSITRLTQILERDYVRRRNTNPIILWHVCWKSELWSQQRQPLLGNGSANMSVARQWLSNHNVIAATDTQATNNCRKRCFLCGPCWGFVTRTSFHSSQSELSQLRVEAMKSETLVAEAGENSGTQRMGTSAIESRYQATASKG
jgi:hypothetical protein